MARWATLEGVVLAWLATELCLGALRPSPTRLRHPSWVKVTRGLWLLGPWVCVWGVRESVGAVPASATAEWAAVAAAATGLCLRWLSLLRLGADFTYGVMPAGPAHRLRTDGPYRWVRHPAYLGLLLLTNFFGAFTGSWLGALLLATTLPNVLVRIAEEETYLLDQFGERYRDYRRTSWRLVPFVY